MSDLTHTGGPGAPGYDNFIERERDARQPEVYGIHACLWRNCFRRGHVTDKRGANGKLWPSLSTNAEIALRIGDATRVCSRDSDTGEWKAAARFYDTAVDFD